MDEEGNTRNSQDASSKFARDTEENFRPKSVTQQMREEAAGGQSEGKSEPRNDAGDSRGAGAAESLSAVEQEAANAQRRKAIDELRAVDDAKKKEEEPKESGFFRTEAEKKQANKKIKDKRAKLKSSFGKYGAVGAIFGVLFMVAFVAFTTMSSQLNSWKENIYAHYGQNSALMDRRSNFILRTVLKPERGVSTKISGKQKFKISSKLAERLRAEGIEYIEADVPSKSGNKTEKLGFLAMVDDEGGAVPIAIDEEDLSRLKNTGLDEFDLGEGKKVSINVDDWMTLREARTKSTAFNKIYNKVMLTVTGKMAGWFAIVSKLPQMLMERIVGKNQRNQTADIEDNSTKEEVTETMAEAKAVQDDDVDMHRTDEPDEEDDNGEKTDREKTYDEVAGADGKLTKGAGGNISAVAEKLRAKAQKVAALGGGGSAFCGFLKAIGAITSTVGAIQTMNMISVAARYLEVADRIKAQEANNGLNLTIQLLNEDHTNKVYDDDGNEQTLTGATTESAAFNMAFAQDDVIDEDAPEIKIANRELAMTTAVQKATNGSGLEGLGQIAAGLGGVGSGLKATQVCNMIQRGASTLNLVADGLLLVSTWGVGNGLKVLVQNIFDNARMGLIMVAVGAVIQLISPMVAQWLGDDLSGVCFGIVGGTLMWSGAQVLMNSNTQTSTGLLVNAAGAAEMMAMTKDVEQEWALYDRQTLSPFDTSSQYTFLGSIVSSLSPLANQLGRGVTGTASSIAKLTGDSALALLSPTASAADGVANFTLSIASEDNCYRLHSVGAEGTETCQKYNGAYLNDVGTADPDDTIDGILEIDPNSFQHELDEEGNWLIDEEGKYVLKTDGVGNPKIEPTSDLGKYVLACVASDAQPGEIDAEVQGELTKFSGSLGGFIAGTLPGIGDVTDLFQAAEEWENLKWNSKAACTGRTAELALENNSLVAETGQGTTVDVSEEQRFDEKIRYYSDYVLDQRVMEEMELIESNAVVAFLEDYYEENPLDDSYEGQIARFSGQTKEQVEDTLAFLDYFFAVQEYDPGERYAFGEPAVKIDQPLRLDHESVTQVADTRQATANMFAQIVYADVRNRVMTV